MLVLNGSLALKYPQVSRPNNPTTASAARRVAPGCPSEPMIPANCALIVSRRALSLNKPMAAPAKFSAVAAC